MSEGLVLEICLALPPITFSFAPSSTLTLNSNKEFSDLDCNQYDPL